VGVTFKKESEMVGRKRIVLLTYLILQLCSLSLFAPLVLAEDRLSFGDGYGLPGTVSSPVEVLLENDNPVRGVQFTFHDEYDYLTIKEIHTTERTEGFYVNFNQQNGTVILVSLSGKSIVPGSGPILIILFYVSEDAPEGECTDIWLKNIKVVFSGLTNTNALTESSIGECECSHNESGQFCFTESMPTTTTTTSMVSTTTTTCCPIFCIYDEYSEETELLRYIRDNVLSKTPEGQEIIRLYYQWSPVIVKAMEEDEEFKEKVKKMIDGILPLIRGEVE